MSRSSGAAVAAGAGAVVVPGVAEAGAVVATGGATGGATGALTVPTEVLDGQSSASSNPRSQS